MKTDLRTDPIHLPPGGVARIVEDFGWDPERLGRYAADTKGDGADGRLVSTGAHLETGWLVTITPGQGTEHRPG